MPLVCTVHQCAWTAALERKQSWMTRKRRLPPIFNLFVLDRWLIHEDFSTFHDEDDAAHGGDVLEGVAIEGNDVGVEACSDGAGAILDTEGFGGQRVGGNHGGHGILAASLHTIQEFLGVSPVGSGDRIGPENDFEPASDDGAAKQFLKFGQDFFNDSKAFFGEVRSAEIV